MSPYDWGAWNIGESTMFELGSLVNGVIQATGAQNEACYRRGEGVDSGLGSADEAVFSVMRVDNDKWEVEALLGPSLQGYIHGCCGAR